MPRPDVIVIGAGFAGLSAAVRLVSRGARVLVLEERRRLGGRATAFPDPTTGEPVDNGQHALFGCYHETFAFLKTIGTDDGVRLDERLEIEVVDQEGTRTRLRAASLPSPLHLVGGLLRWPALTARDRVAALKLGLFLRRAASRRTADAALDLDGLTVSDWLARSGQTRRLVEMLWEPLAVAALNQSPATAAAAPFVRVLGQLFTGSRQDSAIGLPRLPLDQLFAVPAVEWLRERGSEVRTGEPATLVVRDGRLGLDVRGETFEAPIIVSSVPWYAFAGLSENVGALAPLAEAAARMTSSPIVTVNLWFDRPITETPFVGLPGRQFQWVFDKAQLVGDRTAHLSLVSSGADRIVAWSNDQLVELAVSELGNAFPAVSAARLVRATAVREKRATFSLAPGEPARPAAVTAVPGLLLAGDWTDTGLPATIEGAVLSGHRAADLAR
jgi:hydroxysqualene dehydroxylase